MFTLKHLLGVLWLVSSCVSSAYCSSGGESTTFRKQDDHGNYAFGYDINDGKGGNNFHKETGDEHGNKRGSYGLMGPDGRMRIVHYIADEHGFRVDIKSNEVSLTEGKAPAAAVVNGKDGDENSDYSSVYGQRTSGYHPPSPLYLSSTSNHPSSSPSKPYYLSQPVKHAEDDHSSSEYSGGYPSHQTSYTPPSPKPKYSNYALAAKSYYPKKNIAYEPKYNSYHHSYPKNRAYEPPNYSSSYNSPSYGSTNYGSTYEPTSYPSSVHKPLIKASYEPSSASYAPSSAHDYNSVYESPVYGTRKSAYASDLYSKSAEPVHSYTKLSGYASKKHNEKIKYYNDPYEQPKIDTSIVQASSTDSKKAAENEEVAKSYRTESNNGIISAKSPKKLSSLISLTSYRNPYSIDTEYKSS